MPTGLKPDEVCAAIDALTAKSQSCQGPANQINIVNIALAVSGFGPIPVAIARLSDIVTTTGLAISSLQGTQPFTVKSDEDAVIKSLTTFVEVHQALLNILIGKAGLVPASFPTWARQWQRSLGKWNLSPTSLSLTCYVLKTIAYELIDLVPDDADDATKQKDSLDGTLTASIDAWSGGITLGA